MTPDSRDAALLTLALDPRHRYAAMREMARMIVRTALQDPESTQESAADSLGVGISTLKRWIQADPSLDPARRTIDRRIKKRSRR